MKRKSGILVVTFFISYLLCNGVEAQSLKYCKMLGKTYKEVTEIYGNPTYGDNSNPDMQWFFYQFGNDRITFVSNQTGVYQVQADISCSNEKDAMKKLSELLKSCTSFEYAVDTVNASSYKIKGTGLLVDLYTVQNTSSGSYNIKYKANKTEAKKE